MPWLLRNRRYDSWIRIYDRFTGKIWAWLQPSAGHFGLIVLRFAVVSILAVSLAYISRKYYEEWFLQLKDRIGPEPAKAPVKVLVTAPSATVSAGEASESLSR